MVPAAQGHIIGVCKQAPVQRSQESMVQRFPSSQFFGEVEQTPDLSQDAMVQRSFATHLAV